MENKGTLSTRLSQLEPLIGRWNIVGSFKDIPDKTVEGWETYTVVDNGEAIESATEIRTLISGKVVDVYVNKMLISFHEAERKILGDDEWEMRIEDGVHVVQNGRHRFTGTVDPNGESITGHWENRTSAGGWKYWYDKVLTRATT